MSHDQVHFTTELMAGRAVVDKLKEFKASEADRQTRVDLVLLWVPGRLKAQYHHYGISSRPKDVPLLGSGLSACVCGGRVTL